MLVIRKAASANLSIGFLSVLNVGDVKNYSEFSSWKENPVSNYNNNEENNNGGGAAVWLVIGVFVTVGIVVLGLLFASVGGG